MFLGGETSWEEVLYQIKHDKLINSRDSGCAQHEVFYDLYVSFYLAPLPKAISDETILPESYAHFLPVVLA